MRLPKTINEASANELLDPVSLEKNLFIVSSSHFSVFVTPGRIGVVR